jgi:hypothetical protein
MADIRQFSEQSQQRIADAVRTVERSPILRPQPFVRTTSPTARELRWARTTTSLEFPSYPDNGNAVVIEFGDYAISGSPIVSSTNTPSFTAYDPEQKVVALMSGGTLPTQGSVVQCYRHEGQWWIEGTTEATVVHPVYLFDASWRATTGATYPRGGTSFGTTEFYTLDFGKYRGDAAANKIELLDADDSGDPFLRVLENGYFFFDLELPVKLGYSGSGRTSTLTTTVSNSTTPGHSHDVDAFNGRELSATVQTVLRYRVNNTGTLLTINESSATWLAFANNGSATSYDTCVGRIQYCVNLTANWYIQLRVFLSQFESTSDHTVRSTSPAKVRIQYLGETASDVNI